MEIVTRTEPERHSSVYNDLRTSLEVGTVEWALIQADYARKELPVPMQVSDLHPSERRKYRDLAVMALLLCDRDAELYAEGRGADVVYQKFEEACKDICDQRFDNLEEILHRAGKAAIQQYRAVLMGLYPGLSRHLALVRSMRLGGGQ